MGTMRGWNMLLAGAVALAATNVAFGDPTQYEWNSASVGNWTDPTKWTPNGVPGSTAEDDEVYIGRSLGDGGTVILDSAVPSIDRFNIGEGGVGTLDVRPGASLTTTTMLSADAIGLNGEGTLLVSGGSLTLGRRLVVNNGTLDISGGTVTMPDAVHGDVSLAISGVGELTVRGSGRLDVGRDLKVGEGGVGTFTLGGGQVNVGRNLVVGLIFGFGELTITGGQLNVTGDLTVGGQAAGGTLNLQSATAVVVAGAFDVSATGAMSLSLGATQTPIQATTSSLAGDLTAAIAGNPSVGTVYSLLRVGGDGAHTTTFNGKPQGAVFLADAAGDDIPLRISYEANLDGGSVANDVTLTVLRRGDATLDGAVNRADVARIVANWHAAGGYADGDLDGNGIVGLGDLMTLHRHLGGAAASSAAAVPEPAAWATLLAAAPLIAVFPRRHLARGTKRR